MSEEKIVMKETVSMAQRRKYSFICGGILAAILLAIGIFLWVSKENVTAFVLCTTCALVAFTLSSCLILANNFVGEMLLEILTWGFVKFPGLIFTLDLDGIIWLLTVKLLFWILGIMLAIGAGLLAIVLSGFASLFIYPFAIKKSFAEES